MLESLLQLNVSLLDLGTVVVLAKVFYFFSELFKVMRSFHQFELLARVLLLRLAHLFVLRHGAQLAIQGGTHVVEVGQEGYKVTLVS